MPGRLRPQPSLVLAGGQPEAALEVAVQVALVGEAGHGGRGGDRLADFQQAAGGADAVRDLQRARLSRGVGGDRRGRTAEERSISARSHSASRSSRSSLVVGASSAA
jgi:hypothetical protein